MDIESIVAELRNVVPFKQRTDEGDLVLVVMEKAPTAFYAMVTHIERDISKRDEWWHLTLQILTVPPQKTVWTLREEQFTGREIFTMGGEKRFMQAVLFGTEKDAPDKGENKAKGDRKSKFRLVK